MPTPYERPPLGVEMTLPTRPPLARDRDGGLVAGVCAGVAAHLGVRSSAVRWTAAALTLLGGAAVPAYLFLWAVLPGRVSPGAQAAPGQSAQESERSRWLALVLLGAVGVAAGIALLVPTSSLGGSLLVPGLVIAVGAVIAWSTLDRAGRQAWLGEAVPTAPSAASGWLRTGLGAALALIGILVLVTRGQSLSGIWDSLLAAVAVLLGMAFILAPWGVRLWGDLRREQEASARASERADIAAHLHDSVLQTLALIQRQSTDPIAVTRLARAQERELRSWLYAGPEGSEASLAPAVTAAAHDVEDLHGVPIELVVTGDRPLEAHGQALVAAFREALLNAVRHGEAPVTAYVEIGPQGVEAFVRDRGTGFDLEGVPADRLGVRQSIIARMERHGGAARIRRREDGTEVELTLPALDDEGATP